MQPHIQNIITVLAFIHGSARVRCQRVTTGTEARTPGAWAACAVPSQEPLPVARTQRRMLLELHYCHTL